MLVAAHHQGAATRRANVIGSLGGRAGDAFISQLHQIGKFDIVADMRAPRYVRRAPVVDKNDDDIRFGYADRGGKRLGRDTGQSADCRK